ncbi:MAG: cob(I)yrinic acid a,c-diamide adenosyltransferase [Thermoleophilia bacterium]|nr:cob(I)yrinic acid a,c-diamide adenosyltransferase [Thermoleophilia bacterium]
MVRLDRIYTRGGDLGETSLGDGHRVAKHNPRVAAYGTVDELNAALGVARLHSEGTPADAWFVRIQNDLFDVGADLCVPPPPEDDEKHRSRLRVSTDQVAWLEQCIDEANSALPPLTSFVVPGGTPLSAYLHVARTICRRAERDAVALAAQEPVTPEVITYLNRLSDLLFVLARAANGDGGETMWKPGASRV